MKISSKEALASLRAGSTRIHTGLYLMLRSLLGRAPAHDLARSCKPTTSCSPARCARSTTSAGLPLRGRLLPSLQAPPTNKPSICAGLIAHLVRCSATDELEPRPTGPAGSEPDIAMLAQALA